MKAYSSRWVSTYLGEAVRFFSQGVLVILVLGTEHRALRLLNILKEKN